MPNWVYNTITADKDLEPVRKLLETDYELVDFNNLIPMPKELNGIHRGARKDDDGNELRNWREVEREDGTTQVIPVDGDKLIEKYGASDWYGWACDNWGTKWNACNSSTSEYEIYFETAWAPPMPIFEALSMQFPDITFSITWEEEQGFGEELVALDGDITVLSEWDMPEFHEHGDDEYYEVKENHPYLTAGFYIEYPEGSEEVFATKEEAIKKLEENS